MNISYTKLFLWDQNIYKDFIEYKRDTRKYINEDEGNTVIMSLGDNYWDYGDYGGIGVHVKKINNNLTQISYH